MSKQDTIISLLKEIDKNIDNIGGGGNVSKVKVSTFKVTNACINDDGIWEGESLIDTSECTTFAQSFRSCKKLKHINATNLVGSKAENIQQIFDTTGLLGVLDVSSWDVSNVTNFAGCFGYINNIDKIIGYENWNMQSALNINGFYSFSRSIDGIFDFRKWEIPNVTTINNPLHNVYVNTLVGGENIESVIQNNTCIWKGAKANIQLNLHPNSKIDRASLRALINGLADLTGSDAQTLSLGETLIAKLTEEDIAIATAKNWTIA